MQVIFVLMYLGVPESVFTEGQYNMLFICSFVPPTCLTQLVKMAKRLKKEKVSVDIINFGEEVNIYSEGMSLLLIFHVMLHFVFSLLHYRRSTRIS